MNNISISYAISACNEHAELLQLLTLLTLHLQSDDEIVIVTDTNATQEVNDIISSFEDFINIIHYTHALNKNFAEHKNFINSCCTKQYILNIDADELPSIGLLGANLKALISDNESIDIFNIPRINIVRGITNEYINQQHWNTCLPTDIQSIDNDYNDITFYNNNEVEKIINFPDYQKRLYKNDSSIYWIGKVHETLTGLKQYLHYL